MSEKISSTATITKQVYLTRRTSHYWRVTFDHPPLNIFGPESIPQLNEIVTALETDEHVKVVIFDSAVQGFFLTHYDFLARIEDTTGLPPGPTGLQPLPDMLVRLSRAPVVSIASIRGRATGVGSELALACDMRFASREKAILSQLLTLTRLSSLSRSGSPRSTNRRSAKPSVSPTSPVCPLTTKSRRNGTCALRRSCDRRRSRGSRS